MCLLHTCRATDTDKSLFSDEFSILLSSYNTVNAKQKFMGCAMKKSVIPPEPLVLEKPIRMCTSVKEWHVCLRLNVQKRWGRVEYVLKHFILNRMDCIFVKPWHI